MSTASWALRATAWLLGKTAPEGEPQTAPYHLPISGGWLGAEGDRWNWWQAGYDLRRGGPPVMVDACVAAYSQTVAMCPGAHWRLQEDGGRRRVPAAQSALARVLRRPNHYQSISDLLGNLVRALLYEGNAYAFAVRNERYEVAALHWLHPHHVRPMVGEDGSVFYSVGAAANELLARDLGGAFVAPGRDFLHLRLFCPEHPLIGVSPITSTALAAAAADAALAQQVQFYRNQARPSFVLSTEQVLNREQVEELRARWSEQATRLAVGGTPILTAGLKPVPLGLSAQDSSLIKLLQLSDRSIATALRVPHVMVGLEGGNVPATSAEALMNFWLASGLGHLLNHVEEAMGALFGLAGQPEEYLEFDTGALLRPAYAERVEGLARAVQGGLMAPNEARAELELPAVLHGDEPRVQQQVVPLSAWATAPPKTPGPAPAPPAPVTEPPPEASTP